jgi:hypothetical protein
MAHKRKGSGPVVKVRDKLARCFGPMAQGQLFEEPEQPDFEPDKNPVYNALSLWSSNGKIRSNQYVIWIEHANKTGQRTGQKSGQEPSPQRD